MTSGAGFFLICFFRRWPDDRDRRIFFEIYRGKKNLKKWKTTRKNKKSQHINICWVCFFPIQVFFVFVFSDLFWTILCFLNQVWISFFLICFFWVHFTKVADKISRITTLIICVKSGLKIRFKTVLSPSLFSLVLSAIEKQIRILHTVNTVVCRTGVN